ncbi:hypothetical protein A2U01_0098947, partial [Trifolium medium]|nr:hypothetical protein [Trifolium medium]
LHQIHRLPVQSKFFVLLCSSPVAAAVATPVGASLCITEFHPSGLALPLFLSGGRHRCLSINPLASWFLKFWRA